MRRRSGWIAVAVLVAACGTPAATTVPGSVPAASGSSIQLRQAPGDLGCDTIGVPYRDVTFRIDPTEAEHVIAVADTGAVLQTFWSTGFRGASVDQADVVVDADGAVVAADGDVLAIPQGDWPRLHGYFVCPSLDALYILSADPT